MKGKNAQRADFYAQNTWKENRGVEDLNFNEILSTRRPVAFLKDLEKILKKHAKDKESWSFNFD